MVCARDHRYVEYIMMHHCTFINTVFLDRRRETCHCLKLLYTKKTAMTYVDHLVFFDENYLLSYITVNDVTLVQFAIHHCWLTVDIVVYIMHTCLPFRFLRNYYGKAHQITVLRRGAKLLRTFWITEI